MVYHQCTKARRLPFLVNMTEEEKRHSSEESPSAHNRLPLDAKDDGAPASSANPPTGALFGQSLDPVTGVAVPPGVSAAGAAAAFGVANPLNAASPDLPLQRPGQTDVVLYSQEDQVSQVLYKVVENLWQAVNELTRLRRTQQQHYYVSVFGSARIETGSEHYVQVKDLAWQLAKLDCGIITGGGPGLMQAANEGIVSGNPDALNHSIGIRIDLPYEFNANPFIGKVFSHKTFFSRLHQFMISSDAFIVVPGGVGTLLELSMVWQLLQVRKLYDTPLILVGDMWKGLLDWAHTYMIKDALAAPVDLEIPLCVDTSEEAVEIIRVHKIKWEKAHRPTP